MIEASAATIPWMVATGNHDTELFSAQVAADTATVDAYGPLGYGGLTQRMDLPATGPSACPSVYSFTYGNVGVISLDANELSWEIQGLLGYSKGAQVRWLEAQLAAWRRDPRVDFIVAFFHECAFSTCDGHSSDGGVRSKLAPLFSKYQVDLAVQGHNHVYERTNPLIYDAKTNSAKSSKQAVAHSPAEPAEVEPAKDGTTYVAAGTAGHAPVRLERPARERPQLRRGLRQRHHRDRGRQEGDRARTSASSTSASGSRRSTGRRCGTPTTASSRSTSPRPRGGTAPRWCSGSSTSRAGSSTGSSSHGPREHARAAARRRKPAGGGTCHCPHLPGPPPPGQAPALQRGLARIPAGTLAGQYGALAGGA